MNDPYKTPQSDVAVTQSVSKTRWKILFWIILSLEIVSIVFIIINPEESILEVVIELIIYPIIIVGVFGFSYGRKIFFSKFWISIIPIGLSYDIYSLYKLDWVFGSTEEIYFMVSLMAVIVLPLMFFQYLALYKYSFKSPEIWQ